MKPMEPKTLAQKHKLQESMDRSKIIGAVDAGCAAVLGVETVLLALDGSTLAAICVGAVAALNAGLAVANGRNVIKTKRIIDDIVREHTEHDVKLKQLQKKYQKQR